MKKRGIIFKVNEDTIEAANITYEKIKSILMNLMPRDVEYIKCHFDDMDDYMRFKFRGSYFPLVPIGGYYIQSNIEFIDGKLIVDLSHCNGFQKRKGRK